MQMYSMMIGALFVSAMTSGWATAQQIPDVPAKAVTDPGLEANRAAAMQERHDALRSFRPGGALQAELGPTPVEGGPCFVIQDISVDGAEALSPAEIGSVVHSYTGRCLQGADIQRLMERFDQIYAERGHITTRSYLPPQNLTTGQLALQIVEGKVAQVVMIDPQGRIVETHKADWQAASAFPGVQGRLFQLRDFEQGLDQMNRLKSVKAVMRLQPGVQPGDSDVLVLRQQGDRFRGILTFNNKGAESTGQNKIALDVEADDLIGINDSWSFGYNGSRNTNALALDVSVPWGYWTLGAAASYSEYLLPLTETAELFGTSESYSGKVARMLRRDQVSTTEAEFELAHTRAERFVNGAPLTPQWLTTARIGVRHIRQEGEARLSYDASLKLGLPILNASEDAADIGDGFPRAQFTKLEGGLYRVAPLADWGRLQSDLRLQYAPTALYPVEQVSLGSETTIRGYEAAEAVGDSGFWWRNDIQAAPEQLFARSNLPAWANNLQLTSFADMGAAHSHASGKWQAAAGVGIGVGYATKRASANMTVAVPLIQDNEIKAGDPLLQLNVTFKAF